MTDVAPIHQAGGEVDQVVGLHGEQVRRHKLTHGTIALLPLLELGDFIDGPMVNRLPLLLIRQHRRSQPPLTSVFRSCVSHGCESLRDPTRTGLSTLHALFNDVEILINVFARDLRITQTLARKREQVLQNERRGTVTLSVNPLELSIEPMSRGAEKV